jgi:hypothetical protein
MERVTVHTEDVPHGGNMETLFHRNVSDTGNKGSAFYA